jgi:hypothetical protein
MFDPPSYSDCDRWINVFFKASAGLDARGTAVIDVCHPVRYSAGVHREEFLKVLESSAHNHPSMHQPGRGHADD